MFTGLVERTGVVAQSPEGDRGGLLAIETVVAPELALGESVAVNGVCLTVVAIGGDSFQVVVSPQTLRLTTAGQWQKGQTVNLERALRADARLGGHFVLGHVDGVATLLEARPEGESRWLEFSLPADLARYVVAQGSIAVDGISLTVAQLTRDRFAVQIVPHTWSATTLRHLQLGDHVNLEVDVLAKHVERLLMCRSDLQVRPE